MAQIAEEIGSSKEVIRSRLKRFGIGLRRHGFHHGHPSQARYGTRVVKGTLVPHLGESEVIELIRKLRATGMSLREVAIELSHQRIPTKQRVRVWHPEMVRRILHSHYKQ